MEKFADMGIGSAVVQRKYLDGVGIDTAFTLKFAIGTAVTAATFLLAFAVPLFTRNPDTMMIVQLLSLCFLFNNLSFLPNALLMREMNFKKISAIETTVYFLNAAVTITLALTGKGYWSIVLAYLSSSFFGAFFMVLLCPVTVHLRLDRTVARQLLAVGGYLFLSGLFAFLISNVDNFIIGLVRGAKALGYYVVAFNWGSMICITMYSIVLRVIFPLMAKLQDQLGDLRNSYLKTLQYTAYVVVFANIVLLATSKSFLVGVLGHGSEKWLPALASLRILCLYGILRGLLEPINQVVIALGKTRVLFQANLVASVIELSCIYPALTFFGIEGVAAVVTMAYLSQYPIFYRYLKQNLHIEMSDLSKAVRPSFLAALPVLLTLLLPEHSAHTVFFFLQQGLLVATLYLVSLGVLTDWKILLQVKRYFIDPKQV